jgi:hypothetical protein
MSKIDQKIADIQRSIGGLEKKADNPFFKSQYVELNQIIDALRPLEVENKISITFPLNEKLVNLVVQDLESEECVSACLSIPETVVDPQKFGSFITYFRRYLLMSLFNLKAEDDDGNHASGRTINNNKDQDDF